MDRIVGQSGRTGQFDSRNGIKAVHWQTRRVHFREEETRVAVQRLAVTAHDVCGSAAAVRAEFSLLRTSPPVRAVPMLNCHGTRLLAPSLHFFKEAPCTALHGSCCICTARTAAPGDLSTSDPLDLNRAQKPLEPLMLRRKTGRITRASR
jgi:hypothetical protein